MTPFELALARGQGRPIAVVVARKKSRPYHAGKKPKKRGPHD